jgi:dipeptidyl aminopeptidase/acylaminoacyl peptidase
MLSLAKLLQIPNVDNGLRFAISPDEERIVFSWNKSGSWELYTMSLRGRQPEAIPNLAEDCFVVAPLLLAMIVKGAKFSPRFSPDGTKIALALDPDGSESYHICVHDLMKNSTLDLTSQSGYAQQPNFDFSPDGKRLAILSDERGQFALYVLDIETGKRELLLDLHRPIWDVKWSPDGRFLAVEVEAKASDRMIVVIEIESGKSKVVSEEGEALNAQHSAWSPDSKSLAFSCQNGEWHNIGLYNVETQEIIWLTNSAGDDTQPAWSRSGESIGWVHAEGAKTSFQACTEPRRSVKERGGELRQIKVGDGIHAFPQFVSDGVILVYEDVNHPPDLWKINLETDEALQLTKSLDESLEFIQPEEIWYAGADGARVPALLYRGKGRRAVLNIHGGPNWRYAFGWEPFMSYLAARGWTVLAPNYRGSTGYGKAWQNASRFDMGGVDNDDCAAGAKYLLENGLAEKVAVTGRSHGGYLTMCCLTSYPDLFEGGSAVVPFLNWFKSHEESREDLQHWNIENMGDPETHRELWHARSPYFFLDKVNAPAQMICGANDPRCPASDSLDARDKLVELGKEVELLLYEDEGHSFLKIENVIDAEVRRVEFLERVLE